MSQIILHHYALSPYSEKVRLAMGLKDISWSSVDIPIWTPRPKLTPMTGGYRKTPILQVGAEFYCDTLHIIQTAEKLGNSGALYPKGQEATAKAFGWWIEKGSFFNAVCLTIGNMPGIPQELIDERRPLFRVNLDPGELRPRRPLYLQRLDAHLARRTGFTVSFCWCWYYRVSTVFFRDALRISPPTGIPEARDSTVLSMRYRLF